MKDHVKVQEHVKENCGADKPLGTGTHTRESPDVGYRYRAGYHNYQYRYGNDCSKSDFLNAETIFGGKMKSGIQTLLGEAGEAACYALDIIEIAERELWGGQKIDPLAALYLGIERGYIHYNEKDPNDNDNFFVKDPAAFLAMFAGGRWTVKKTDPNYAPAKGEHVVDRWKRVRTRAVIGHFRLPDWGSLHDSMMVRHGKIVSKRVFRRVG